MGDDPGPKACQGSSDKGKAREGYEGSGLDLLLAAGGREVGASRAAGGGGGSRGAHAGGSSTPASSRPAPGWDEDGGSNNDDLDPSTGLPQWARDLVTPLPVKLSTTPLARLFAHLALPPVLAPPPPKPPKLIPDVLGDSWGEQRFSSDMLDGAQVSYILHNVDRLRKHALSKDSTSEQFCTYDRHPPATALEPQSGVVYLIRTQEGLQDKAISLKSVATGPSNFVWKMAWGRKTHLKSSGVLYKSYRCRYLYRPKNSPPPFRMQIYVLEESDIDTSKGETPTPGLALIHILSVQDAPPRHWPSCRQSKRRGKALEQAGEAKRSPRSSANQRLQAADVRLVPATPYGAAGAGASPPSGNEEGRGSAKASKVNTKLEDLYSPPRPDDAPAPLGFGLRGRAAAAAGRQTPASSSSAPAGGSGGRSQRLQPPPAQGQRLRGGARRGGGAAAPSAPQQRHSLEIACDPIKGLGGAYSDGVGRVVLEGTSMMHEVARRSFPEQAKGMECEFGGLSAAVLAGFVTGTPWGMPGLGEWAGGAHVPDYTALGWAKLLSAWEEEKVREAGGGKVRGLRGERGGGTPGPCGPVGLLRGLEGLVVVGGLVRPVVRPSRLAARGRAWGVGTGCYFNGNFRF